MQFVNKYYICSIMLSTYIYYPIIQNVENVKLKQLYPTLKMNMTSYVTRFYMCTSISTTPFRSVVHIF